jgi:hypothetical protein
LCNLRYQICKSTAVLRLPLQSAHPGNIIEGEAIYLDNEDSIISTNINAKNVNVFEEVLNLHKMLVSISIG